MLAWTEATCRAVLFAVVGIGKPRPSGGFEVGASVRQVADGANVGVTAAHRALRRLERDGWLRVIERGSGIRASVLPGWSERAPVASRGHPGIPSGNGWNPRLSVVGQTLRVPPIQPLPATRSDGAGSGSAPSTSTSCSAPIRVHERRGRIVRGQAARGPLPPDEA